MVRFSLPSEEFSSEQIEDTLSMLSELGINVVENDEADDSGEGDAEEKDDDDDEEEGTSRSKAVAITGQSSTALDRTDDPVRMYLREMGSVELLSREGEIAIAKRIEAGRETMIAGLCESPLTFQAIIIWRDELLEGKILLRDIIDLDATFAGPDAKKIDHSQAALNGEAPPRVEPEEEEVDDDGEESDNSMSLAAMEAELKPKVLESFDKIANDYKKLRKLQDSRVEAALKGEDGADANEKKYQKLTADLIEEVKSLSLNNNRIESLVEQLYAISKRLMGLEGRLLRIGESHGIPRVSRASRARAGRASPRMRAIRSKTSASRSRHCLPKPVSTLPNIAASCPACRRANAKPASPRRKWSRPICVSSSPSPRNIQTVACNSSILFRKAISA